MTVAKVTVQKHTKGVGWYLMTICSMRNFIGTTKIELLLREETLRAIREGVDRALSNKPVLETENLFTTED